MSDGESNNEFLKGEDENDPIKVQKEAVELQKEGIKLMKEALAKKQPPPVREPYIATSSYLPPVGPKLSLDFQVRKIQNGHIIASRDERGLGRGPYSNQADETFCQTAEELVKAAALQVKAFTNEAAPAFTHSGPPPFQLEPGEAV